VGNTRKRGSQRGWNFALKAVQRLDLEPAREEHQRAPPAAQHGARGRSVRRARGPSGTSRSSVRRAAPRGPFGCLERRHDQQLVESRVGAAVAAHQVEGDGRRRPTATKWQDGPFRSPYGFRRGGYRGRPRDPLHVPITRLPRVRAGARWRSPRRRRPGSPIRPSAMEKPRSVPLPRQVRRGPFLIASSSASGTSRTRRNARLVAGRVSTRLTICRTLRIARPPSEKSATSTIASSPSSSASRPLTRVPGPRRRFSLHPMTAGDPRVRLGHPQENRSIAPGQASTSPIGVAGSRASPPRPPGSRPRPCPLAEKTTPFVAPGGAKVARASPVPPCLASSSRSRGLVVGGEPGRRLFGAQRQVDGGQRGEAGRAKPSVYADDVVRSGPGRPTGPSKPDQPEQGRAPGPFEEARAADRTVADAR